MTGQQPRIVPPEEARLVSYHLSVGLPFAPEVYRDLAHTAAVLGEQRAAVLALHVARNGLCVICRDEAQYAEEYPCPTARALGVT